MIGPSFAALLCRMLLIELPRALEEYFAFAETDPTRQGRRFSITLPFYAGDKLDRLQWWYHVSASQEQMYDGEGLAVFRARAIERFRRHIEQWLANTKQRLHGEDAIPRISKVVEVAPKSAIVAAANIEAVIVPRPKVVNG